MRTPEYPKNVIAGFEGDAFFMSNFFDSPIVADDGILYPTVEHAFQAQKTLSPELRRWIAGRPSPGLAKRAGWNLPATSPLRADWNEVRLPVMRSLLKVKFAPFSDLAWRLVETYPAHLVEANNWHDNYWGDCRCGRRDSCRAEGVNQLGKDLVAWRDYLIYRRRSK
jgi:ribA/ribD-fused uncharacterized protein